MMVAPVESIVVKRGDFHPADVAGHHGVIGRRRVGRSLQRRGGRGNLRWWETYRSEEAIGPAGGNAIMKDFLGMLAMVGAGMVGALLMAAIGWAGPSTKAAKVPEVVEAQKFVLKDAEGKDRAMMYMAKGAVHFTLLSPEGH